MSDQDDDTTGAIDTDESYNPDQTPHSNPTVQQAGIPDVGPSPLGQLGEKVGSDISQGVQNFKQNPLVRGASALARGVGNAVSGGNPEGGDQDNQSGAAKI